MDKLPPKPRRLKGAAAEDLMKLEKNELVEKIMQMEAHIVQLKNIISKQHPSDSSSSHNDRNRKFDFSKCHYRRVLLRFLYFGWDYHGLATQEDSTLTIEHQLFNALTRSCLIESREKSNYHRCGRTDKGVSSFGQVISISLRSRYPEDEQNTADNIKNEIEYCKILNRILPKDIKAVAWMPIPRDRPDFSARFDCTNRIYKYYFPRSTLDLSLMGAACDHLVGHHDFRNLCKMDVGNGVTQFMRHVTAARILPVRHGDVERATSMYYLRIEGNAFLWHQIRCIFGVLLLIGRKLESPDVVLNLLDVEKTPCKPQYSMALDTPLNLYHCEYELERDSEWVCEREELKVVIASLQASWTIQSVKAAMIEDAMQSLEEQYKKIVRSETGDNSVESEGDIDTHTDCLLQGVRPKVYKPLLKRDTCSSLEDRIEFYRKKRKIGDPTENMDS